MKENSKWDSNERQKMNYRLPDLEPAQQELGVV